MFFSIITKSIDGYSTSSNRILSAYPEAPRRSKKSLHTRRTMAKHRNKKSVRTAHKRKRPAPYAECDGQWNEDSIQRQLSYVPQLGNAITWYYPYAWPYQHVALCFDANHSAPQYQQSSPVEAYAYKMTPELAEQELDSPFEAEIGSDGATYYSPRRELVTPYPATPETEEIGGTTYYSPRRSTAYPSPPASEEEEVRGYIEGYHDPKLEHQTSDWWRLFGATTGELYVLDGARKPELGDEVGAEASSPYQQEEVEWSVTRYFAPYRTPEQMVEGQGEVKECKNRDDWDCDFCGSECFCWTVDDRTVKAF
jgi:hypothetical protein